MTGSKQSTPIIIRNNLASAFSIKDRVTGRKYIDVDTVTGSEKMDFGNTTENPAYNFLGTGAMAIGGAVSMSSTLGVGAITTSGDLLISKNTPTLTLLSPTNNQANSIIFGHSDDADAGRIIYWGSAAGLGAYANGMSLYTNGTESVFIASTGAVSMSSTLDVAGNITMTGGSNTLGLDASGATNTAMNIRFYADRPSNGNSSGSIQWYNNGVSSIAYISVLRGTTDLKGGLSFATSNVEAIGINENQAVSMSSTLDVTGLITGASVGSSSHLYTQSRIYSIGVGTSPFSSPLEAVYLEHTGTAAELKVINAGGTYRDFDIYTSNTLRMKIAATGAVTLSEGLIMAGGKVLTMGDAAVSCATSGADTNFTINLSAGGSYPNFNILGSTGESLLAVGKNSLPNPGRVVVNNSTSKAGLDVHGNLRAISGTISTDSYMLSQGIYAEITTWGGSTAQSMPTGAYTKATGFIYATEFTNCAASSANDNITPSLPGKYRVSGSFSFSGASDAVIWEIAAFYNGTRQPQCAFMWEIVTAGDNGASSFSGIVDVTAASLAVDVRVTHDGSGSESITFKYMNLNVEYIGET